MTRQLVFVRSELILKYGLNGLLLLASILCINQVKTSKLSLNILITIYIYICTRFEFTAICAVKY